MSSMIDFGNYHQSYSEILDEIQGRKTNLFKLTNASGIHRGHTYKEGLNVDSEPWNENHCSNGGLYLCRKQDIFRWLYYSDKIGPMMYVWDAEIDFEEDKWNEEDNKIKTHSVVLSNRRSIVDLPEWKSGEIQLKALKLNPWVFKYIVEIGTESKVPCSEEIALNAVKQLGTMIRFVKSPSEQVQLAAVQSDGFALEYFENPSEQMKLAAVTRNGHALRLFNKWGTMPSQEIIKAAIRQNPEAITHFHRLIDQVGNSNSSRPL